MGICSSCESTSVATAKLILRDGRLQEFSYPVRASYLLQKDPTSFICNSDEMEFDTRVSAVSENEELQPGQIYFALPVERLRQPLQPEEMAALAVRASSALMKSGGGEKCGCRRKTAAVSGDRREKTAEANGGGGGGRRIRSGSRGSRDFKMYLSAIPE